MFRKLLIANRGEIAVRIIRACREMDIQTVAVYSDADRAALHVLKADEAYPIGPAAAAESYLRIEKIIGVAQKVKADAIHPGYGFLSENPDLARACADAGIVFIGPSAAAMEQMGSKTRARQTAQAAGVPVVPGTSEASRTPELAHAVASSIGYPVMVKAAAGGGGKGMRLVRSADEMPAAFRDARSEAQNAFGDSDVYIEKLIETPRHIEIQILGDHRGNMVHLGERECSIQRRHQKVIEESPSPIVDAAMRERMGEAAVRTARAAEYTNAGTIEFLVDAQRNFYFLEMNTRLQVEHPVTEAVTGLDLVKLQIQIAAGEPLPFGQQDIAMRGAAVECRIYAEDPDNNFFPCPGRITSLEAPAGPGVRDDSGVYAGWTVPVEYDPLLSKLVTWGATREEAVARMRRALDEYYVGGIKANLAMLRAVLRHPEFLAGRLNTAFLDHLLASERTDAMNVGDDHLKAAALAAVLFESSSARHGAQDAETQDATSLSHNRWRMEGRKRLQRRDMTRLRR
jgi:acetyl-CoA carboxylase biotin carboxylase subunit